VIKTHVWATKSACLCGGALSDARHTIDLERERERVFQESLPFVSGDEHAPWEYGRPIYKCSKDGKQLFTRNRKPSIPTASAPACDSSFSGPQVAKRARSFDTKCFADALRGFSLPHIYVLIVRNIAVHDRTAVM